MSDKKRSHTQIKPKAHKTSVVLGGGVVLSNVRAPVRTAEKIEAYVDRETAKAYRRGQNDLRETFHRLMRLA